MADAYRPRVEVHAYKNLKGVPHILATRSAGGYEFPGGGIEQGQSAEDAAIKEMLEETGYKIDLPTIYGDPTNYRMSDRWQRESKSRRGKDYTGVRNQIIQARLGELDTSLYNSEGDAMTGVGLVPIQDVIDTLNWNKRKLVFEEPDSWAQRINPSVESLRALQEKRASIGKKLKDKYIAKPFSHAKRQMFLSAIGAGPVEALETLGGAIKSPVGKTTQELVEAGEDLNRREFMGQMLYEAIRQRRKLRTGEGWKGVERAADHFHDDHSLPQVAANAMAIQSPIFAPLSPQGNMGVLEATQQMLGGPVVQFAEAVAQGREEGGKTIQGLPERIKEGVEDMKYYKEQLGKAGDAIKEQDGKALLEIYRDNKIRSKGGYVHDPVGDYVRDTVFAGFGNTLTIGDRMRMASINRKKIREMTPEQRAKWNKENSFTGKLMSSFRKGRDKAKQKARELALAGSMRVVPDRGVAKTPVRTEYVMKKKAQYQPSLLGRKCPYYI